MMSALSIFSLDFLALECLTYGDSAYYNTVYLWCLIPIFLGCLIVCLGLGRIIIVMMYAKEKSNLLPSSGSSVALPSEVKERDLGVESEAVRKYKKQETIINQHVWLLLFLSYIVLPAVSNKQLEIFDCIDLNHKRYLRSDTGINCRDDSYVEFKFVVIIFLFIYQLIPVIWFVLLYRQKDHLNPNTLKKDENLSCYIRDNNSQLRALRFLFVDYKCSKWWFEIADMYRRIIFIGVLPLVSPNPATRSSFGVIVAIISVAYFREEQPYRVEFTNVIAHIAQVYMYTYVCAAPYYIVI
jgi:hypothetical protein